MSTSSAWRTGSPRSATARSCIRSCTASSSRARWPAGSRRPSAASTTLAWITSTSTFTDKELDDFLNRMLEAERAGAKALVRFLDEWPRHGEEWAMLRKIHEDEAHNCALIGEQLKRRGREYSHATGEFYDKAVAVKGAKDRIGFLIKGLRWAMASSTPRCRVSRTLQSRIYSATCASATRAARR